MTMRNLAIWGVIVLALVAIFGVLNSGIIASQIIAISSSVDGWCCRRCGNRILRINIRQNISTCWVDLRGFLFLSWQIGQDI